MSQDRQENSSPIEQQQLENIYIQDQNLQQNNQIINNRNSSDLVLNIVNKENFNQRQFQQFKRYDLNFARFQIPNKKKQIYVNLSMKYHSSTQNQFDYSPSSNFIHTSFQNETLDIESKIKNLKQSHNKLPTYYNKIYKIVNKQIDQNRIYSAICHDLNEKHTTSQVKLKQMEQTVYQMRKKNETTLNQLRDLTNQIQNLNEEIYKYEKLKQKLDETHNKNFRNSTTTENSSHQKKQWQIAIRGNIIKTKNENQQIYDSIQKTIEEDQKTIKELKKTENDLKIITENFQNGKNRYQELKQENDQLKYEVMVRSKFLSNFIETNNGLSFNRKVILERAENIILCKQDIN